MQIESSSARTSEEQLGGSYLASANPHDRSQRADARTRRVLGHTRGDAREIFEHKQGARLPIPPSKIRYFQRQTRSYAKS